jgi:hypothetical protein
VHLLLNSTALPIQQLVGARKKLLVEDAAMLERMVGAYSDAPGTFDQPELFFLMSLGTKRPYRGYPIHTLVCNDATWQAGFGAMADRCGVAVVNLSGYNPSHPGLEYEVRHLLAGGPPKQFVFLYERLTDADAVISSVLALWARLDGEPARTPSLLFVRVPDSQDVGYSVQFHKAITGTGWLAGIHLQREGPYVPVAGRIMRHLSRNL